MYYLQIHFLKVNLQMIPRFALPTLERLAKGFRVVALTGPRQSGKTTLARSAFKEKPYVSLENPDELEFARSDPRRFLGRFKPLSMRFSDVLPSCRGYKVSLMSAR
jgi:predicted AAA+ superfamily ATPase